MSLLSLLGQPINRQLLGEGLGVGNDGLPAGPAGRHLAASLGWGPARQQPRYQSALSQASPAWERTEQKSASP